jgi:hypothetical protein
VDGGPAWDLVWQQGRQCESGACVEVASFEDAVLVRSSSDPDGARLTLRRAEWAAFLDSAKDGLFDSL